MGIGFCRKSVGGRIGSGACVHVIAFGAASAGGSSGLAGAGCRTIDRPAAAEEQAGVVVEQTTLKGQARRELLLTPELLSPVVA